MGEYTVPIVLFAVALIVAPLAFIQLERDLRPTGGWFARWRKPKHETHDYPDYIVAFDRQDAWKPRKPAGQCDWCGKFRKGEDLTTIEEVSHDRLESYWVPVCRVCRPGLFEVEPPDSTEA